MKIRSIISEYRWPIILGGLLGMSIIAQGVLVYFATRPDAPRPIANYYERGLEWDADAAQLAASRRLGWKVKLAIPGGEEYAHVARRPVDVTIRDRDDQPVTALTGRMVAIRPANNRLNGESTLVALPHRPGCYRTLARLPVAGLWELSVDARKGDTRFVHTERVMIGEAR